MNTRPVIENKSFMDYYYGDFNMEDAINFVKNDDTVHLKMLLEYKRSLTEENLLLEASKIFGLRRTH